VEQIAVEARQSEYVDQKSGVSARLTITVMEHIVSAAENRMLMTGEESTTVRISDLYHAVPAITGKLELVYEGEQEGAIQVANHLVGKALNSVFKTYFPDPQKKQKSKTSAKERAASEDVYSKIITWFSRGNTVELPDILASADYGSRLDGVDGLKELVEDRFVGADVERHAMMDFVLDALHQNSMLGRANLDEARSYSDMLGSMLTNLSFGDDDDDDLDHYGR
jgi:magnesium chelatase subunit I